MPYFNSKPQICIIHRYTGTSSIRFNHFVLLAAQVREDMSEPTSPCHILDHNVHGEKFSMSINKSSISVKGQVKIIRRGYVDPLRALGYWLLDVAEWW
jgi:hypothetical protein